MQFLLVALLLISAVSALPDGAPVCIVGGSAVQNLHLLRKPVYFGLNEDKGYIVTLNGIPILNKLNDPTFVNLFQFGQEYTLTITTDATTHIKGVLVIASAGLIDDVDSLDTRTPRALSIKNNVTTKESLGCENFMVSSITHTTNNEKASIDMYFKWPTYGQKLFLDVNIVKNTNVTVGSQYSYNQYPMLATNLTVQNATSSPVSTPVTGPVTTPVTTTPVNTPVSLPVASPISTPVMMIPIMIPVASSPVSRPVTTTSTNCGLFKLNIFCLFTFCGIIGRPLGLCDN